MALWDAVEGEGVKAFNAFKIYLRMGDTRTLEKVSRQIGHANATTVARWSAKYRWVDRVMAFEEAELESVEGNQIMLMQQNQSQVLYDMFKDYNEMLDIWRMATQKVRDNLVNPADPEHPAVTMKDLKLLIETRREIDNMARKAVALPNVVREHEQEDKSPKLPERLQLILPNGITLSEVPDEDYADSEYDSDEEE